MNQFKNLLKLIKTLIVNIFFLASAIYGIFIVISKLVVMIREIISFIINFKVEMIVPLLIAIGAVILIFYIVFSWERRDDFFFLIACILNSPSNYFYERRKKQLINYRDEVKELTGYITYFSKINPEEISSDELWLFVDKVSKQNEFLEKNRRKLEKADNKINIFVQIFILICGVITALIF